MFLTGYVFSQRAVTANCHTINNARNLEDRGGLLRALHNCRREGNFLPNIARSDAIAIGVLNEFMLGPRGYITADTISEMCTVDTDFVEKSGQTK